MPAGYEVQVRLYRDALTTPWGFRLHGGKDLKSPLTVQKVAAGSPVFGELQRDDVIYEIQNCDATQMTHRQAQDMIRNAGGSMLLRVRRTGVRSEHGYGVSGPIYDTSNFPQRGFTLTRVKDTLDSVLTPGSSGYGSNSRSSDYGEVYSPTSSYASADSGPRTKTWSKPRTLPPPTITPLMEPGWTPECLRQQPRRRPVQAAVGAAMQQQQQRRDPRHHQQYPHATVAAPAPSVAHHDHVPAWYGSLRSVGDTRPSDRYIGGVPHRSASPQLYGGGGGGGQGHLSTATARPFEPPAPSAPGGAMNLQYNTPVGLYSKANLQEAFTGQMAGLSGGETTIAQHGSAVHRLVQDDARRHGDQQTHHLQAPAAGDDAARQSPSMNILESRFVHADDTHGTSDF